MNPSRDAGPEPAVPTRPRWAQRLHVRFLAIVTASFLLIILPAAWLLFGTMQQTDNLLLTSRIGNLSARAAGAIDRHGAHLAPALARDLLAPLAADRAFLCAELRQGPSVVAAVPTAQGCVAGLPGERLEIPVGDRPGLILRARFKGAELVETRRLELALAISAVTLAFLAVLAAGSLSYRLLIWRPLSRLNKAIALSAGAGPRHTVDWNSRDEIGLIVQAYNRLVLTETERERELETKSREIYDLNVTLRQTLDSLKHTLLLAEERLHVAFEAVSCGIIAIDQEGVIQRVNLQAQKMFDYTENEMLGSNVSMLMSGDHAVHHDRYISNYVETGDAKIIGIGREVSGSRKDGSEVPLFLGIGEMDLDGDRQFIASLTDLTAQRNIEFQLRRAQKMDAMGQLTGGLAHDFNNLLGIIVGNLELAQRKSADVPAITQNLNKALAAAGRGTNLTRRLLNFSRQTPTDLSAVDLNEVVSEFRHLAAQSVLGQTELQIHLDPSALRVLCNQSDLEDALLNISINARDAMPDGGRLIIETGIYEVDREDALTFAGLSPGIYGTLTFSDTGIGMPREIQERIFEPFFTTKAAGKGTGLGMPMVYGFVQRSKGHIAIYSEQGLGTTVRLYLPAAEEIRGEANPDLTDAATTALPRGTEKILIVDDETGLREIAEAILSELGYRTAMAENGDVALRILRSIPDIDLLFTDLVMPGSINGLQLAETIQKERPDLKVLLTSGFSGQIMDKESAERWAGSLLSKPYTNAKLAQAIRSKLDQDELLPGSWTVTEATV